ncbi:MAG: HEPN domain-containing protein [bacterium]
MFPSPGKRLSDLGNAFQTWEDAKYLFENKRLISAMNGIYYSMFYAVNALALALDFKTSKHSSLISWFSKTIIQPGLLSQEIGEIYKNAFDLRHKGDYHDFAQLDQEEVLRLLEQTRPLIETIQRLTHSVLDQNQPSVQ